MMELSSRFSAAVEFCVKAHEGQVRKGTKIPYASHPLAVAALVLEHEGSEDQSIAALLHDTIEDCGVTAPELEKLFGPSVASMVLECSDFVGTGAKGPWRGRKESYLAHLDSVGSPTLLVSACDKLHNSSSIVRDLTLASKGNKHLVWTRFSASPADIVWYYESLVAVFSRRAGEGGPGFPRLLAQLKERVNQLAGLQTSA